MSQFYILAQILARAQISARHLMSKISNLFEILELIEEFGETNKPKFLDFLKIHIRNNSNFNFLENWRARQKYSNFKMGKSGFFKNQNRQFLKFVRAVTNAVARTFSKML